VYSPLDERQIVSMTVFESQYGKGGRGIVHEMPDIGGWITLLVE
jgi:hypothetical protein